MPDLDPAQRSALIAAHQSINHGGLQEGTIDTGPQTVWKSTDPDRGSEHMPTAVWPLIGKGLLSFSGKPPHRVAQITEHGILELDCAGVAS